MRKRQGYEEGEGRGGEGRRGGEGGDRWWRVVGGGGRNSRRRASLDGRWELRVGEKRREKASLVAWTLACCFVKRLNYLTKWPVACGLGLSLDE